MIDYLHRSPCICWYHIVVLKVLNSLPIRLVDFFLDKDEVAFSQLVINHDRALEVLWLRNIPSLVLEEVLRLDLLLDLLSAWSTFFRICF